MSFSSYHIERSLCHHCLQLSLPTSPRAKWQAHPFHSQHLSALQRACAAPALHTQRAHTFSSPALCSSGSEQQDHSLSHLLPGGNVLQSHSGAAHQVLSDPADSKAAPRAPALCSACIAADGSGCLILTPCAFFRSLGKGVTFRQATKPLLQEYRNKIEVLRNCS